ncbi:Arylesterase precursor [Anatilimnocola aggregata]|uniref:Arylesterase n=1 Tax=Anatilimnocola aggregata TaxID=2528021 RepID=A0A517YDZ9_9BACT|nr:GDSL-type esterase/lipase family protein [Anatilimnocola aggregata]QDU28446.1 Arylesterase precursor [Anatilimnocola aggregata]
MNSAPFAARMATVLSALLVGFVSSHLAAEESEKVTVKAGDRIVFLGDSITAGGVRPDGYVTLIKQELAKQQLDPAVEIFGAGISGNKVPDLQKRLERDVLSKKPTIVFIYIGINDVWHSESGRGTSKENFEAGLKDIIQRIRDAGAKVVLCTASVIGEKHDGSNKLDKMLDEYCDVSRAVAQETKVQMLDLRKVFLEHSKANNSGNKEAGILTSDRVHLNAAGNQFVAHQMLGALGVQVQKTGLLRHVVLFKFKSDVTKEQVQEVVDAFGQLPKKIAEIKGYEAGTDVSVEGKSEGFTHGFVVTFADEKGRDVYLPHPAHGEFVKLVGPRIDKVLVFDYWTKD